MLCPVLSTINIILLRLPGIDLAPDEVGQNPINYSRYKTMIQDLIRAGNIPPTKVDMHALKDNKYTLQELKDLVQTFKVNDPAVMYPTPHAASREDLVKLAENKLSDILKEMPMRTRAPREKIMGRIYLPFPKSKSKKCMRK